MINTQTGMTQFQSSMINLFIAVCACVTEKNAHWRQRGSVFCTSERNYDDLWLTSSGWLQGLKIQLLMSENYAILCPCQAHTLSIIERGFFFVIPTAITMEIDSS